jgi:hypothetical protein
MLLSREAFKVRQSVVIVVSVLVMDMMAVGYIASKKSPLSLLQGLVTV